MNLGEKLKHLIENREMTQKDVATALGIPVSTFNGYVQNYREPDFSTLISIAKYFDVSIDYLLDYHINSPDSPNLSEDELKLIQYFRKLPFDQQKFILEQEKMYIRHNYANLQDSSSLTPRNDTENS